MDGSHNLLEFRRMRKADVKVRYYSQGVFNRPLSSEWFCFKEALCRDLRFSFPLPIDFHHTVFDLYCSSLLSMRIQRCSTAVQRPLQCWFYPVLVYYGLSGFSSCKALIIRYTKWQKLCLLACALLTEDLRFSQMSRAKRLILKRGSMTSRHESGYPSHTRKLQQQYR